MKHNGTKILIYLLFVLILLSGALLAYKIVKDKPTHNIQELSETNTQENIIVADIEEKEVQIYKGNDRPIAVMIDNHNLAWPQAGLNQAYMVYEIIVEGRRNKINGFI